MSPGMTVWPPRSITLVCGPESFLMFFDEPTARILPFRTAIAWAIAFLRIERNNLAVGEKSCLLSGFRIWKAVR